MAQRSREYVQTCFAVGVSDWQIIFVHVLPNTPSSGVAVNALTVVTAILSESGLSFLGLSDPKAVSWDYMIGVARTVHWVAWWMAAIPGLMTVIIVLAISIAGEGLNDALNPRLKE